MSTPSLYILLMIGFVSTKALVTSFSNSVLQNGRALSSSQHTIVLLARNRSVSCRANNFSRRLGRNATKFMKSISTSCTTIQAIKQDSFEAPSLHKTPPNKFSDQESNARQQSRRKSLHKNLSELGIDADALADAAFRSVATTDGFDSRFGKSAIKAYRTYIDPRPSKIDSIAKENVNVAANRCARQIDFLIKRHQSHETEWVRHTDTDLDTDSNRRIFPLILVLDNIRSAFNVGSMFRTADACGCWEVITTGITPHPNGNGAEKLSKSALGAERIVQTRHFTTTQHALESLRIGRPNVMLVGMETTERSRCYTAIKYPGLSSRGRVGAFDEDEISSLPGVALFLGNEVSGVDTRIIPLLDEVVEIPMFGRKNSLNVAACAPVVMYEILQQWGAFRGGPDDASV